MIVFVLASLLLVFVNLVIYLLWASKFFCVYEDVWNQSAKELAVAANCIFIPLVILGAGLAIYDSATAPSPPTPPRTALVKTWHKGPTFQCYGDQRFCNSTR